MDDFARLGQWPRQDRLPLARARYDDLGHNWVREVVSGWLPSSVSRRRRLVRSPISLTDSMICTQKRAVPRCGRSRSEPGAAISALRRCTISSAGPRCRAGPSLSRSSRRWAARRSERHFSPSGKRPGGPRMTSRRGRSRQTCRSRADMPRIVEADLSPRPRQGAPQGRVEATPRPAQRFWSSEIPSPQPQLHRPGGRARAIERQPLQPALPHVQVISGMGGIGKTELATEYIHRNIDTYEIIWWIRAEHEDRVRDALVDSGPAARAQHRRPRTAPATGRWRPYLKRCSRAPGELAACLRQRRQSA